MEHIRTDEMGGVPPLGDTPGTSGFREQAAGRLEDAANALHERAEGTEGRLGSYGRQAADWLDRSARYVREADVTRVRGDLEQQVRRSPGRALIVAGAAGLVLRALLRRR